VVCVYPRVQLVWENAGTGGRHGSLWVVSPLGLLVASSGGKPPKTGLHSLLPDALIFDPKLLLGIQSPADSGSTPRSANLTATPTKPRATPAPVVVRYLY
jgi:hypothetical protein